MSKGIHERKKPEKIKEVLEDKQRKLHNSNGLEFYKDQYNIKDEFRIINST